MEVSEKIDERKMNWPLLAPPHLKIARGILALGLYAEALKIYFGMLSGLTSVAYPNKMRKNKISTILRVSVLRIHAYIYFL